MIPAHYSRYAPQADLDYYERVPEEVVKQMSLGFGKREAFEIVCRKYRLDKPYSSRIRMKSILAQVMRQEYGIEVV